MKKMFRFAKTAALVFAGASLVVSCQKENVPSQDPESGGVKYAQDVTTSVDVSLFGGQSWLLADQPLDFLKEAKNQSGNFDFANQPSGVQISNNSKVYLTFVGNVAAFNNVLGYYYYNPNDLPGKLADIKAANGGFDDVDAFRAFILSQIFDKVDNEITYKHIVYAYTRNLAFGTTYEIKPDAGDGDIDGNFVKGTVVGFFLLPNAGNEDAINDEGTIVGKNALKVKWDGDKPIFNATHQEVNLYYNGVEMESSHLMGRSACKDLVIAFEDMNGKVGLHWSDYDYNDLVFVVNGNNLVGEVPTRLNNDIVPFNPNNVSESLDMLRLPELGANCLDCGMTTLLMNDAWFNKGTGFFNEGKSAIDGPYKDAYLPLFSGESKRGYIITTGETDIYAYCQNTSGDAVVNIGWYYYKEGQTLADIGKSVTVDGSSNGEINDEYLIYKNLKLTKGTVPHDYVAVNKAAKIPASSNIGFFLIAGVGAQQPVVNFKSQANKGQIRVTTLPTLTAPGEKEAQAQLIMKGNCETYLISFEDLVTQTDYDYNDITFSLTDNTQSLTTMNFDAAGYYDLRLLLSDLGLL